MGENNSKPAGELKYIGAQRLPHEGKDYAELVLDFDNLSREHAAQFNITYPISSSDILSIRLNEREFWGASLPGAIKDDHPPVKTSRKGQVVIKLMKANDTDKWAIDTWPLPARR